MGTCVPYTTRFRSPERRSEDRMPAAHDHNVAGHRFTFNSLGAHEAGRFDYFTGQTVRQALIAGRRKVKTRKVTMPEIAPPLSRQIVAALAWRNEAGVDCDFHDEATDRLAEARPAQSPLTAPAAPHGSREDQPLPPPPPPDSLGAARKTPVKPQKVEG